LSFPPPFLLPFHALSHTNVRLDLESINARSSPEKFVDTNKKMKRTQISAFTYRFALSAFM
jgi:hypothetical protein